MSRFARQCSSSDHLNVIIKNPIVTFNNAYSGWHYVDTIYQWVSGGRIIGIYFREKKPPKIEKL